MPEANINDRHSVERLYPRADFERDAGENSDPKATVYRGLRILSSVADGGAFRAERGSRHVAESDPQGDTVFLVPFPMRSEAPPAQVSTYGGMAQGGDAPAGDQRAHDYRTFIDRIIEAAKTAEFKPAMGRHETRLRGFHGG